MNKAKVYQSVRKDYISFSLVALDKICKLTFVISVSPKLQKYKSHSHDIYIAWKSASLTQTARPDCVWKQSITEWRNMSSLWGPKGWRGHGFGLVIFCTSRWLMVFAVFAFCAPNSRPHLPWAVFPNLQQMHTYIYLSITTRRYRIKAAFSHMVL